MITLSSSGFDPLGWIIAEFGKRMARGKKDFAHVTQASLCSPVELKDKEWNKKERIHLGVLLFNQLESIPLPSLVCGNCGGRGSGDGERNRVESERSHPAC
jgi:hypothetical protein